MTWFTFILISVIATSVANIYRRIVMKDDQSDAIATAIIFQFIGTVIVGVVAVIHGFQFPPVTKYPINFLIGASFWGTATLFLFKASQTLQASESTIITTLSAFVSILGGILFLGEGFSTQYIIGTLLIISTVVVISQKSANFKLSRGVLYALGFCLFSGLGYTNDAFLTQRSNALSYLTIGFLTPGIFLLLTRPKSIPKVVALVKSKALPRLPSFTFVYALGAMAFIWSISIGGNIAQVSPIAQSAIILTVILGTVFLKERDYLERKIICAILVTIGVLLLR